jgi:hypothetical protein
MIDLSNSWAGHLGQPVNNLILCQDQREARLGSRPRAPQTRHFSPKLTRLSA